MKRTDKRKRTRMSKTIIALMVISALIGSVVGSYGTIIAYRDALISARLDVEAYKAKADKIAAEKEGVEQERDELLEVVGGYGE